MTLLVLTLAVVALVPVFALNIRAGKSSAQAQQATLLSQELLDEVRLRRWDENTPTPPVYASPSQTLGLDAGETAADKRTFDDIDDFKSWTESSAVDPVMRPIPGLPRYARSVSVSYVTSALAASVAPTDYKLVTACTKVPRRPDACLSTLVTNR